MNQSDAKGIALILIGALLGTALALGLYQWESTARAARASLQSPSAPSAAERIGVPAVPSVAPERASPTPLPQTSGPAATSASPAATGGESAGAKVFAAKCNACHPGAEAGMGPALHGPQFAAKFSDDAALKKLIRDGKGGMPSFSVASLSEADLDAMVAYLRSLK